MFSGGIQSDALLWLADEHLFLKESIGKVEVLVFLVFRLTVVDFVEFVGVNG